MIEFVVAGIRTSCDKYGPLNRCLCADWPWPNDAPLHDSHWWDNHGSPWWCGGDLNLDWRLKARKVEK